MGRQEKQFALITHKLAESSYMLFISTRFKFIAAAVPNETEELEVNPTRKQARAMGKRYFFCVDFETLLVGDWLSLARSPESTENSLQKISFLLFLFIYFFTFIFRRPAQRKIVFLAFYLEVCKALTRDSKVKTLSPHKEMSFFFSPRKMLYTTLCLRRRSSGLSPIPTKKETDTIEDDQHDDVFQHCGKVWKTFHEAATTSLPKRFN